MAHPQHHVVGGTLEPRLLDQDGAVARAAERAGNAADTQSQVSRDDPQLPGTLPAAPALDQQLLAYHPPHDFLAERHRGQVARGAAAAERRTHEHDSPRRQLRLQASILEGSQDHQAAQAVPDQVQGVGANLSQHVGEIASDFGGIGSHRRI
jgi:hypothetical protein